MNRHKFLILEDVSIEASYRLTDLLHGDEDMSAFFEDPYLEELMEVLNESESPETYH